MALSDEILSDSYLVANYPRILGYIFGSVSGISWVSKESTFD